MELKKRLSDILSLNLPDNYTAISYAIMMDGEIVAADALGTDGSEENRPVTMDHTFNVCSISKIFCTTAVMKLVEQGKLDLDTPIYHYLPDFKMADQRYKDITLRHCLSHSSGLPGTQWKHFSATHVGSESNEEYYQEVYDYMANSRLKADPGKYSVYCNDGFTLAEMVVAKVSGIPFGRFCRDYITEPIGAHSTRPSTVNNPAYPLVHEKNKVPEYFYLQGCGGFTTTMTDLCRFGNLFLTENDIIGEESKAEMAKHQGRTFLEEDTAAIRFGLGWDNVDVREPDFDFGDHVLAKSGNSFQFNSMLYIIPKYNAVLAISETHDCRLDVGPTILNMFATALLETKGENVFARYKPVPAELIKEFDGTYLMPSMALNTHFFGTSLTITGDSVDGKRHRPVMKDLRFDGENFIAEKGEKYFFRAHGEDKYIFMANRGRVIPQCMKAKSFAPLSPAWQARIGKRYIPINFSEQDMAGADIMCCLTFAQLPNIEGVVVASFHGRQGADIYGGGFDGSMKPVDDHSATGFLQTPSNGSRDLIDVSVEFKDGVEYCHANSYIFRDAATLPVYKGETFDSAPYAPGFNSAFKIEGQLKELPAIPQGHRIVVMDKDMYATYDSQIKGEYKPQSDGYILLI